MWTLSLRAIVLTSWMTGALCAQTLYTQASNDTAAQSRTAAHPANESDGPEIVPRTGAAPDPATLAAIAAWLSWHFDLPVASDLPQIKFVSPQDLVKIRYSRLLSRMPMSPDMRQAMQYAQRDTLAVYDDSVGTIFLQDDWQGGSPAEISLVVHEMVHHLQRQAQIRFECPQERERLAYLAQDRWLEESGSSLEGEFGIDPFTRLIRTRCLG